MADKRIIDLFEITVPNTSDVIPIASAGLTRKVTLDNFVQQSTYSTKNIGSLTLQTTLNPTDQLPLVTGSGDVRKITGDVLASRTLLNSVSGSLLPLTVYQSVSSNFILDGGNIKGSSIILGTNDSFDLNLQTDNNTRMTITSSGLIGINTASPNEQLTVLGSISATNIVSASAIVLTNLPTLSTGLPTGTVWIDISAGNVLKVIV